MLVCVPAAMARAQPTSQPPVDLLTATNNILGSRYGVQTVKTTRVNGLAPGTLLPPANGFSSIDEHPSIPTHAVAEEVGIHPHAAKVQVVESSPLVAGPVTITQIPSQTVIDAQELTNCAGTALTTNAVNLSVAIQRTTSITETKTVTNGGTFTVGGEFRSRC